MGREEIGDFNPHDLLLHFAFAVVLCMTTGSVGVEGQAAVTLPPLSSLCPDGWMRGAAKDKVNGELCLYLSPQVANWTMARDWCHSQGAFLLTVDSVISVQDTALRTYLARQGVDQIWTGMHKDFGLQMWDEPGNGVVLAYTGTLREEGVAKRGWYWNTTSFHPADVTCAAYGAEPSFSAGSQQPRARREARGRRARRDDSGTPPTASKTKDTAKGPTEKTMESFKSFLQDQGLKHFADKMSDNPPELVPVLVTPVPALAAGTGSHSDLSPALPAAVDGVPASDPSKTSSNTSDSDSSSNHNLVKRSTPQQPAPEKSTVDPGVNNMNTTERATLNAPLVDGNLPLLNTSTTASEKTTNLNLTNQDGSGNTFGKDTRFLDFFEQRDLTTQQPVNANLPNPPLLRQQASDDSMPNLDKTISSFFKVLNSSDSGSSGSNSSRSDAGGETTIAGDNGRASHSNESIGTDMENRQTQQANPILSGPPVTIESNVLTQSPGPPAGAASPTSTQSVTGTTAPSPATESPLPSSLSNQTLEAAPQQTDVAETQNESNRKGQLPPTGLETDDAQPKISPSFKNDFMQGSSSSNRTLLLQDNSTSSDESSDSTDLLHLAFTTEQTTGDNTTVATSSFQQHFGAPSGSFFQVDRNYSVSNAEQTLTQRNMTDLSSEMQSINNSQAVTNTSKLPTTLSSSLFSSDSDEASPSPINNTDLFAMSSDSAEFTTESPASAETTTTTPDNAKITTVTVVNPKMTTLSTDSANTTTISADSAKITTRSPDSGEMITKSPDSAEIISQGRAEMTTKSPVNSEAANASTLHNSTEGGSSQLTDIFDSTPPPNVSGKMVTVKPDVISVGMDSGELNSSRSIGLDSSERTTTDSSGSAESSKAVTGPKALTTSQPMASKPDTTTTPATITTATPAAPATVSLLQCQQQRRFMCAAPTIVHLTAGTAGCEDGWLGNRLLPRCYRTGLGRPGNWSFAREQCGKALAVLASADTQFYTNLTLLLLDTLISSKGLGTQIWVTGSQEAGSRPDGQCTTLTSQGVRLVNCSLHLPFLCQKPTFGQGNSADFLVPSLLPRQVLNATSLATLSLVCPVLGVQHNDLVIWYKDGQPVPSDNTDPAARGPQSTSSANPSILKLTTDVLRRLGAKRGRLQQPALLQGVYWCRVWRRHASTSTVSRSYFVTLLDVITLQVFVKTDDVSVTEAVLHNELRGHTGLTDTITRGMQTVADAIMPAMRRQFNQLTDILNVAYKAHADTDEVELRTYLCLTTTALTPQEKGSVVDAYLKALYTELVASETTLQREWHLALPVDQSFRLLVTEICPEAKLKDNDTGLEATFLSTPVNQRAVSLEICDGMFTGYATCSGDLQSGAKWTQWTVENTCIGRDESKNGRDLAPGKGQVKVFTPSVVVTKGPTTAPPSKPNADLVILGGVHVEPENMKDLTDRLPHLLNDTMVLTDADVDILADVIHRVMLIAKIPTDVGMNLVKTVNKVLESSIETLQAAQERTQASTRILKDLDALSGKLDFDDDGIDHVRYVTPSIAMEVWNMKADRLPVIGLAATVAHDEETGLSEGRIVTLVNRTWNDLNVAQFHVAIELPDQLVGKATDARLAMAIYSKPGLFLSSLPPEMTVTMPALNGAIISASLTSRNVNNLQEQVKLIFRPLKRAADKVTRCVYWDFDLLPKGGWSSRGCVYNGTVQGRDICLCNHLTNFAILLDFYGDGNTLGEGHETAMSILTIIGLSLSILGLALTIITFLFFKKLRQGRTQQTLFNTCVALLLAEVVVLAGLKQTSNYYVCLGVAVLLHYFITVSFVWMLIEAVLQYLTFVKVLGTYISKYTLKTVLPAWGIPLIPVISVLATDYTQYRGRKEYCWMSVNTFYYAFALPVGIILLFNFVTFVVIMVSLLRRPDGLRSTKTRANIAETNVKAAFTILVLLGLTWIFGFLAIDDARLPFQYLFTIFCSLQGFFIFLLLVARRRQFREQWQALCCDKHRLAARGQKVTTTLSNSTSSNSSYSSSSRSRSNSGSSTKTLSSLMKRNDSSASRTQVGPQSSETSQ